MTEFGGFGCDHLNQGRPEPTPHTKHAIQSASGADDSLRRALSGHHLEF